MYIPSIPRTNPAENTFRSCSHGFPTNHVMPLRCSENDYDGDPVTGKCAPHLTSTFLVRSFKMSYYPASGSAIIRAFARLGACPKSCFRMARTETMCGSLPSSPDRLELIAERKLRRRQLTDDSNVEITGRDLREREPHAAVHPIANRGMF